MNKKKDKYLKCKFCGGKIESKINSLDIVRCQECEFIFCNTLFSQSEIEDTYDKLYNKEKGSHYEIHTETEFKKLEKGQLPKIGHYRKKIIDKYIKNNDSVLEIGSGVGLIGTYLKNRNVKKYLGLEIDEITCEKAKNIGLNVFNADFSYINQLKESYNTIMLWEVLEHLQDVKLFFELSHSKLLKDGLLMFSVPNFDKIKNYKSKENDRIYQDLPPIHLNFFTESNIKSILNKAGFEMVYIYKKKYPYLSFKRLHFYKMLLKSIFSKYEGSTIYVVARKVNK